MKQPSLSSLGTKWLCIVALCLSHALPAFAQSSDQEFLEETVTQESMQPGIVAILDVAGQVELIDAANNNLGPATKGNKIGNGISIVTGPGARADLAFSNGLMMQIQENSRFTVADFEHEPYEYVFSNGAALNARDVDKFGDEKAVLTNLDASEDAWNDLEIEAVTATSEFVLHYGTMIGETKKLQPGSRLDIVTPIGTAGIRGTIWRLTITPVRNSNGVTTYTGTVDVARGRVVFSTPEGSRSVNVTNGFSAQVTATAEGPGVRIDSLVTGRLSPERLVLLNSISKEVASNQDVFAAVQGSPDVVEKVINGLAGVNANDANQFSEAVSDIAQGDPSNASQIAQVATAVALTKASPAAAPGVISQTTSALITTLPAAAEGITRSVLDTTTKSGVDQGLINRVVTSARDAAIRSGIALANSTPSNGTPVLAAVVAGMVNNAPADAARISDAALNAIASSGLQQTTQTTLAADVAKSAIQASAESAIRNGANFNAAAQTAASTAQAVQQSADRNGLGATVAPVTNPANINTITTNAQNAIDSGRPTGNQPGNNNTGDGNTGDGDTNQQPNPNPPGNIADPTQGSTGGSADKPRPTPRPTATPAPTATPRPTPTATPIPTPTPTATPTPRPSN